MTDLVVFTFHYATKSNILERLTSRTKYSSVISAAFKQKDKQQDKCNPEAVNKYLLKNVSY